MNKQWNKDGLTRKKLENDFRIHEPFQVLEKNLSNLLARAFSKSSFLYHYQSLAILNEIKQTDTIGIEQSFILWQNENSPESNREITYLRNALYHKFSDWYQRLNHRIFRDSMSDLFLDMEKYNQRLQLITLSNPKTVRRSLYLLLRILRNLQNKREIYIQEIAKSGETDPSLAVLIAFLKNYQYLVDQFNKRWEAYPLFYVNQILKESPQKAIIPSAWFIAVKNNTARQAQLPKGTGIITQVPFPAQDIQFCYRTDEDYSVNDMKITSIHSLLLEKDPKKYPASRLGFVTSIWQKQLNDRIGNVPPKKPNLDSELIFENLYTSRTDDRISHVITSGRTSGYTYHIRIRRRLHIIFQRINRYYGTIFPRNRACIKRRFPIGVKHRERLGPDIRLHLDIHQRKLLLSEIRP